MTNGITLVALIITIIIMLILVALVITIALNSGLFKHAGDATGGWADAQRQEELIGNDGQLENTVNQYTKNEKGPHNWIKNKDNIRCEHCDRDLVIGERLAYTPTITDRELKYDESKTGSSIEQKFTQSLELSWEVFDVADRNNDGLNETLLICAASHEDLNLTLSGPEAYLNRD